MARNRRKIGKFENWQIGMGYYWSCYGENNSLFSSFVLQVRYFREVDYGSIIMTDVGAGNQFG